MVFLLLLLVLVLVSSTNSYSKLHFEWMLFQSEHEENPGGIKTTTSTAAAAAATTTTTAPSTAAATTTTTIVSRLSELSTSTARLTALQSHHFDSGRQLPQQQQQQQQQPSPAATTTSWLQPVHLHLRLSKLWSRGHGARLHVWTARRGHPHVQPPGFERADGPGSAGAEQLHRPGGDVRRRHLDVGIWLSSVERSVLTSVRVVIYFLFSRFHHVFLRGRIRRLRITRVIFFWWFVGDLLTCFLFFVFYKWRFASECRGLYCIKIQLCGTKKCQNVLLESPIMKCRLIVGGSSLHISFFLMLRWNRDSSY